MTRAMLVKANGHTFAIPLDAVEMIVRPAASELTRLGSQVAYLHGAKEGSFHGHESRLNPP